MPIKDILNKVANKEAIDDQEYNELGAWVQQYPTAAPIVNKMMQDGAEAVSLHEFSLVQRQVNEYKAFEKMMADRRELEAAATRRTTLGSKIKDLAASFGEASAAVPGMVQKSVGFVADYLARQAPMSLEMADPIAAEEYRQQQQQNIPVDFRQKVEDGVGKAGTKFMENYVELQLRKSGVEKSKAKAYAANMASDFADDESLKKVYQEMKSPELLARQQLSQERATNAFKSRGGGLAGAAAELGSQVKDLVTDPALLANMAAGQLPIAGVAMATGALGTAAAVGSGAVMQGADVGGQVYDDLMALPNEAWEGNEAFASRVAAGEDPTAVKQDIANAKARQAFAVSGAASAALNATPWGSLSERALAMTGARRAASTNVIKAIGSGVLKTGAEGVTEAAEEGIGAVAGNVAKSPITGEDIFKDVGTATAQGFLGSVAGPSIVAGQVEAMAERRKAMAERRKAMAQGAPPSSGQMISKPVETPTAAPTAETQATQPTAPQAAPEATTATATEVQNAPPVAADEAEARGQSSILSSQLEAKREDIAMQFEDLLAANPDDANMASEAQAWRQKNPLKDAEDFEAYYEQVRLGTIESMAMQDPRTQEAEQQAQVVQEKTEQVMALVESNDTTSAPPPGVTLAQMQAAHADGGKAMQEEAKAAQENARTVQQTVAKQIEKETPKPEIAKTVQKRQKEGAQELSTYIEAVNAGAVSMDPAKFQALGVKAGMSDEAVAMKMATVQKKQDDKAAEAAEEQGFTQAPRGGESQNLSGLNAPPTAAPGALLEQGAKEIEKAMASSEHGAPLAESPSFGSKNRIFTEQSREEALTRLRAKMQAQRSTLNSMPGMDPELMRDGMLVVGFYLEAGVRKFVEVSARVAEDLGATVRELRPYLRSWYNGARDMMEDNGLDITGMDSPDEVAIQLKKMVDATPLEVPMPGMATPLVEALLAMGRIPSDNRQLRAMLAEIDGKAPDDVRMKEGQEALEVVMALNGRATVAAMRKEGASTEEIFGAMSLLYQSQPRLEIRTSTSMENQAYSTPLPLSFLAGELAGLEKADTYEPTAGNGMLLIGADASRVWANELDPMRYERLQAMGFKSTRNGDAAEALSEGFVKPKSMDAVIANPPFGAIVVDGEKVTQVYDNYQFSKIDHLIAAESLRAMKDNGRAVLIIGGVKFAGKESMADKVFLNWLHRRYNVIGAFQADGALYQRQGAAWPVRVLVINGRGQSARLPNAPIQEAKTWEEVLAHGTAILGSEAFGKRDADGTRDIPEQQGGEFGGDLGPTGGQDQRVDPRQQEPGPGPGSDGEGTPEPGREGSDRGAGDGNGSSVPATDDAGLQRSGADGTSAGASGSDGEPIVPDGSRSSVDVAVDLEALTQPYTPKTYTTELDQGVYVPTNLKAAMEEGEAFLREKIGEPVLYVQEKLKYSEKELKDALMGLQVESVAASIYHMENGRATIIADDTGIGKGRQAYMMIRWAILNGKIPVFMTEKPSLFSAIYQDAMDCGDNGLLKPYIVNDDAWVEIDRGDKVEAMFKPNTKTRKAEHAQISATGELPDGRNAIFVTYSQFQMKNIQRSMLANIAPKAILVMDEAHLASGEESARGEFFRKIMKSFQGGGYFSATWAKRPGNMSLYTMSAIGDLGMTSDELSNAVARGGLPLQSIIASSMAKNSMFYRRERSFEGVEYNTVVYGQDGETSNSVEPGEHAAIHDRVTECFRAIIEADRVFSGWFENELKPQLEAQGALKSGTKTTESALTRAPFTSIVHNGIRLISLSLKADWVADMAIRALKNGEAPVIALENTAGTFLRDYVTTNGLKKGSPLADFGWNQVLRRYLDRTRYYNITNENGKTERVEVPLEWLPAEAVQLYEDALAMISELDVNAPASPIDWIKFRLRKEGYSVEEITGQTRSIRVDYGAIVPVVDVARDGKKDHERFRRDFNAGKLDVVIANVAGATGISLHCDKRWTDPNNIRRRHMVVAQAPQDINIFKQMLGRVHRTGQLVPPKYSILSLDLPSEFRPIAMLQKKFKSLNASTSSNTKGNMDVHGVDLLNRYGDEVVEAKLRENPEMASWLGIDLQEESDKTDGSMVDIAKDATGKLAILPVSEQIRFYEMVIPPYLAYIDFLTRTGQNRLIKRMLDYRATEVSRKVIYPGTGVQGPFSDPAWIVELKGRNLTMAIKPENVQEEIDAALGELTPSEHRTAMLAGAAEEWNAFSAMIETSEAREKAQEAKRRTADRLPEIGSQWKIKLMGDDAIGVVVRLRREEGKGNPYAPSKWHVRLATNASCGHFEIPLTTFSKDSEPMMGLSMQEVFAQDAGAMQKIRMVMGNIFGAYTQLDKDGEIVSFSMEDGSIQTGMLLPKSFDITKDIRSEVKIQGGQNITDIMVKLEGTVDPFMVPDESGAIVSIKEGQAIVELDSTARANVLKWTALTGKEFTNGKAVIPVGDQTTKAFENVAMKMDRDVLQDIGVMKEGVIDPSAMKDPNNVLDMTPEFIRSCCDYLNKHGIQADGQRMGSIMDGLRRKRATISSNAIRMTHLAERIRNREPIDLKTLKSFVQELFGRSVRKIDAKKAKASESASRDARETLNQCKAIGQILARTNGMSKIEGRRVKTGLQNYKVENTFGARIRSMFPFIPAGYEGFNEIAAYTEYSLWAYNQKHPEEPINSLADSKNQAKFMEYLNQGQKLQANPWLTAAALGIGAAGTLAATAQLAPWALGAAAAGIGLVAARKVSVGLGKFLHRLTPAGKILSVQANGLNAMVVENLNQVFTFAQQIHGESGVYLERIKDRVMREAVRSIHGDGFVREKIESSVWTSKEVQAKMGKYARAIGDYLEGVAPLPSEIESIGNAVEKLRGYWADHIQDVGGNVIDGHFHRVYDFDGLQAMKGDNKALKRLVKDMAAQTMSNAPDRVEEIARRHLVPLGKASEILTMTILQTMYDGTEESKKNAAKLQSQNMDRFVAKLLNDEYGEVDRKLFNIIMSRMKNQVSPYTASGMKRRSIPFQLPETWALSDGSEVKLVERDYFKVQAHYNETMARSVAQKKVFLKGQANRFLNSITKPEERESIKQAIRNELWHRYFSESDISETTRKAMKAHRDFNSVVLLGLSPMFAVRNLLFGPPKAMALVGYKAFFKGGAAMRFAIPGRRGEEFERARVAGAIMDGVVESTIGNDRRLLRAFMFAARRSQQAVDVAGFYAGVYYSREAVELAAKGDPEAMKVMREVLGPKLAEEVAARDTLELTQDEEDLFGLYYRNLISGSGRGFNLPTFMSSEVAQWILQMKRIPMEDSLIFATRIAGTRAEARYWTGAAFSGGMVMLAEAMMRIVAAALTGDEPEEEDQEAVAMAYQGLKKSGAFQLFEPIYNLGAAMGIASEANADRILLSLHGSSLPIGQAVRLGVDVGRGVTRTAEEEGGATDVLEAMARSSLGYLLLLPPVVKQVGLKDEAQEFQRGE